MHLAVIVLLASILGLLFSEIFHRRIIPRLISRNYLSEDVHKPDKPRIPEPVGPAVSLAFIASTIVLAPLVKDPILLMGIAASSGISSMIGLLDDISPLGAKSKPLLLTLPAFVMMATGGLIPRPILPILGRARLYYVYWPLLMAMYTVFSNSVNMMDALNGMLPLSVFGATIPLIPVILMTGRDEALISLVLLLSVLFPYYLRNKYPARVFGGDSNSLFIGATLAGISASSNTEAFFSISLLPFIVSGFSLIVSVGGLVERREIAKRPVVVKDGMIRANPDRAAPMSMIAILTSSKPKREPEIVMEVALISLFSGILSCLTFFLLTPR